MAQFHLYEMPGIHSITVGKYNRGAWGRGGQGGWVLSGCGACVGYEKVLEIVAVVADLGNDPTTTELHAAKGKNGNIYAMHTYYNKLLKTLIISIAVYFKLLITKAPYMKRYTRTVIAYIRASLCSL